MSLTDLFDAADKQYQSIPKTPPGDKSVAILASLVVSWSFASQPIYPPLSPLTYSPIRVAAGDIQEGTFAVPFFDILPAAFSSAANFTAYDATGLAPDEGELPEYPQASVTITAPQLLAWQGTPRPYTIDLAVLGYDPTSISVTDDQAINNPGSPGSVSVEGTLLGGPPAVQPIFGIGGFILTLYSPSISSGPLHIIGRALAKSS
jgi:hypothetical protein